MLSYAGLLSECTEPSSGQDVEYTRVMKHVEWFGDISNKNGPVNCFLKHCRVGKLGVNPVANLCNRCLDVVASRKSLLLFQVSKTSTPVRLKTCWRQSAILRPAMAGTAMIFRILVPVMITLSAKTIVSTYIVFRHYGRSQFDCAWHLRYVFACYVHHLVTKLYVRSSFLF